MSYCTQYLPCTHSVAESDVDPPDDSLRQRAQVHHARGVRRHDAGYLQRHGQLAVLGPHDAQVRDTDAAEDARFGPDARGDELPSELRRRENRLAAIRAAKERLEAAQRAADDARARQPGQDRNPKGGPPYKRAYGEPDEKAQSNFTDPESGIMKTSNDGFQQCYNAQVAVDGDHQLVVATDLTANASDQGGLPPRRCASSRTRCLRTLATVTSGTW